MVNATTPPGGGGPGRTGTLKLGALAQKIVLPKVVRLEDRHVAGWSAKALKSLIGTFEGMVGNHRLMFNDDSLSLEMTAKKLPQPVLVQYDEPRGVFTVCLHGLKEREAGRVVFRVARQMGIDVAEKHGLHEIIFRPTDQSAPDKVEEMIRKAVGHLPACFEPAGAFDILKKKIATNEQTIDLYKYILALLRPAERPVDYIEQFAGEVVTMLYRLVITGEAEAQIKPWELLTRIAGLAVIARKLDRPKVDGHCRAILQEHEFCHSLALQEKEDRELPWQVQVSMSPDDDPQMRFLMLYELFSQAAGYYYHRTSLRY
jgi:hypothetical protein